MINGLEPVRVRHIYFKHDIQQALLVGILVEGHALSSDHNGVARLVYFARGT